MKRLLIGALVTAMFALFLSACDGKGNKPSGIGKEGIGRGVVSNVDPLNNGMWQIWIFGDNTYVYCTLDSALVEKVKSTMRETDATVLYTYRDWKAGDPEYDNTDASGYRLSTTCGQLYKDTHGSKLLTITLVKNQQ